MFKEKVNGRQTTGHDISSLAYGQLKTGQTFCFASWVQNKGSLSIFCIASGVFIGRNTVHMSMTCQMFVDTESAFTFLSDLYNTTMYASL